MGRASRRKKEQRERYKTPAGAIGEYPSYRAHRMGNKAEQYGRTVGSSIADYEAAGRRGRDFLAAALLSRHNQRMERVGHVHPILMRRARILVNQLFMLDKALRLIGANQDRPPPAYGSSWPDHLGWGADSLIACIRLLLSGQFVGAAQIARSQLERWAINLERNTGLTHVTGESTADYYDRLWSALDEFGLYIIPEHERSGNGERELVIAKRNVRPGQLFTDVSEFLHGRGPGVAGATLEAGDLLAASTRASSLAIGNQILDLLELNLDRIRSCVAVAEMPADARDQLPPFLAASLMTDYAGSEPYPPWGFWPMMPRTTLSPWVRRQFGLSRELLERVRNGERPAGRLFRDSEISVMFYMSHRGRAAELAVWSFEEEARISEDPLNYGVLEGLNTQVVFVAEILGLISRWEERDPVASAAALASSGLRSAFWLWLEDDDRAMGSLRVVLESIARIQTWATKPAKAQKLEDRGQRTKPGRWVDAAGWKRLHALNLALGDLTHTRVDSRWHGARELLVALQPPDQDPKSAPHRGRAYAIECVASLAAKSALEIVEQLSPELKTYVYDLMSHTHLFNEQMQRNLDAWLTRTWEQRNFDFGPPFFF